MAAATALTAYGRAAGCKMVNLLDFAGRERYRITDSRQMNTSPAHAAATTTGAPKPEPGGSTTPPAILYYELVRRMTNQ